MGPGSGLALRVRRRGGEALLQLLAGCHTGGVRMPRHRCGSRQRFVQGPALPLRHCHLSPARVWFCRHASVQARPHYFIIVPRHPAAPRALVATGSVQGDQARSVLPAAVALPTRRWTTGEAEGVAA